MTVLWQSPVVVLAVLAWLTAAPQSLADVARREALRRQSTAKSTASLTNLDLPDEPPPAAVTRPEPPAAAGAAAGGDEPPAGVEKAAPPASTATQEPPAAAPAPDRDEKWWRTRMSEAQATLERDRLLAESVQSRINALQTEVVNVDDPAQQALKRLQLGKTLNELERLRAQITADEKAIDAIRTDARRSGVPPGWIR
jgi:hypothetical protein